MDGDEDIGSDDTLRSKASMSGKSLKNRFVSSFKKKKSPGFIPDYVNPLASNRSDSGDAVDGDGGGAGTSVCGCGCG